jgi:type IV pilus assembly protein PilV
MNIHRQAGITLIEVLVAFFVMTVGLLGLAGMQSTSVKDGLDNAKRSQVMWLVTELVERMRANPDGHAEYVTASTALSCGTEPTQCADTAAADTTGCTTAQIASFDVWEVFCGNPETDVIANSADSLNLSNVSITCDGGATCVDESDYTVTISWESQAVRDSDLFGDSDETQSISMTVRP